MDEFSQEIFGTFVASDEEHKFLTCQKMLKELIEVASELPVNKINLRISEIVRRL